MPNPLATLVVAVTTDTKALVTGFNLAAVAVGAFAAKSVASAVEFDRSMTKVAAISNTSAGAIEGMSEEVLTLAGETAQAPVELADALFFLASAGLDASQVMPALEASAKASAVGLGETADVANIVASALNAYSKTGLTAAQATDTLVAAVREGRAEPEEFANALGRILPIASTVGVTFDQVAASMAALSNIGLDVNEGVTSMRGVLQAIAAPGKQAAEAMDALGLSSQDLLDAISEDGILGALRLLDTAAKQATQGQAEYNNVLRQIIPNVRSLTGVLGLTVQEASKVDAIYQAVANSTGALADAFQTTAESDAFKMSKALNDIAIAGQRVASDALPAIASAFNAVGGIIGDLAAIMPTLLGAFLGFKALSFLPPLLFSISSGLTAIGASKAASTVGNLGFSLQTMGGALRGAGTAVAAAVITGQTLNQVFYGTDQSVQELADSVKGNLEPALESGIITVSEYAAALAAARDPTFENIDAIGKVAEALHEAAVAEEDEIANKAAAMNAADAYVGSLNAAANSIDNEAGSQDAAAAAANRHTAALEAQQTVLLSLAGGFLGVVGSAQQLRDAQNEVNKLQRQGKTDTAAYRDASFTLLQAGLQLKSNLVDYGNELSKQGVSQSEVIGQLKSLGKQYGLQKGDIRAVINEVDGLIGKYGQVPKKVDTKVGVQDNATSTLASIKSRLEELATDWEIRVHAHQVQHSPIPEVLIEQLMEGLEELTDKPWEIQIHAGVQPPEMLRNLAKDTKALDKVLDTLGTSIDDIRADLEELNAEEKKNIEKINELEASLDKLKGQRRAAKELSAAFDEFGRKLERLASKVQEFGDAIRSAFDIDLVGGMSDILNQFNEAQAAFLAGTGEEPAALDLEGFLTDQVAGAEAFAQALTDLQAAGLSQQNLADLASQGIDALPLAQALLGNPQLISALNDAAATIAKVAGDTTDALIEKEFGPAIDRMAERLRKLERSLERFNDLIDNITGHGGGGGGGGGNAGGGGGNAATQVGGGGGGSPLVVNVYGDVLTEGQLVEKLDEALRRKRLRNGRLLLDR